MSYIVKCSFCGGTDFSSMIEQKDGELYQCSSCQRFIKVKLVASTKLPER
jgi:hypothetical protein